MVMVEVLGLTKMFGRTCALRDVSLTVGTGEYVALSGPNGAGKSTLLHILAALSRPSAGAVRIAGRDPFKAWSQVRATIGFLSHRTLLYGDLTARQNLRFYARMYGVPAPDRRIGDLLATVGLANREDDLVRTFSRGMRQRLAIARAVLHKPRLLLLDEPYGGLDQGAAKSLSGLLGTSLADGCTLLMTTHRPFTEGRTADRLVRLDRGSVVYDGLVDASEDLGGEREASHELPGGANSC